VLWKGILRQSLRSSRKKEFALSEDRFFRLLAALYGARFDDELPRAIYVEYPDKFVVVHNYMKSERYPDQHGF
jgi:hypothetical protein